MNERDITRFMSHVTEQDGHWRWTGHKNRKGYGVFLWRGQATTAQRAAHFLFKGDVPEGYDVDHLCGERDCVDPSHLEAVPHRVNVERSQVGRVNRSKTHCPQGHPYSGDNLHINKRGGRMCRTCLRLKKRARDAAKKNFILYRSFQFRSRSVTSICRRSNLKPEAGQVYRMRHVERKPYAARMRVDGARHFLGCWPGKEWAEDACRRAEEAARGLRGRGLSAARVRLELRRAVGLEV